MAKLTADDYAARALDNRNGSEGEATTLLVGWMQADSEVRAALGNIDHNALEELTTRAKQVVRRVARARRKLARDQ
jgi:hypothetical protein